MFALAELQIAYSILSAFTNASSASFSVRCVTYLECKPGVVNEHIKAAMLLFQVPSEATTTFLISDVKLMKSDIRDFLVAQFFGEVIQSIMAK